MGLQSDRKIHTDCKNSKTHKIGISGKMISSTFLSFHTQKKIKELNISLFCKTCQITMDRNDKIIPFWQPDMRSN
jgi:hypothetical protein